jgi:hypothetical protein
MKYLLRDPFFRNLAFLSGAAPIEVERWVRKRWHEGLDSYVQGDFCVLVGFYMAFTEQFMPWLTPDLFKIIFGGIHVYDEGHEFPKSGIALVSLWDSTQGSYQNGTPAKLPHVVLKDGMVFDPALEDLTPLSEYIRMVEDALERSKAQDFKVLYVARQPMVQ